MNGLTHHLNSEVYLPLSLIIYIEMVKMEISPLDPNYKELQT